jgi:eukaryotic-like serine/threonine-protein kinase
VELRPNVVIAERYRTERCIGTGANGEVWLGIHEALGTNVAIKRLLSAASAKRDVVYRFRREAYVLGRICSDYVARILDFLNDPVFGLIIVLEYIEGESLFSILNSRRYSVEQAIELGIDIASGVADLHILNILHRDLKPGNIIIQPRPRGRSRAVLVDFGMSRLVGGKRQPHEKEVSTITNANTALGTLSYMAPEQILNSRDVTVTADIYAIGAILYRAVAGAHAHLGPSQDSLVQSKLMTDAPPLRTGRNDKVSTSFEAIVGMALERKPSRRFSSAENLLHALEELQTQVNENFQDAPTLVSPGKSSSFEANPGPITEDLEISISEIRGESDQEFWEDSTKRDGPRHTPQRKRPPSSKS